MKMTDEEMAEGYANEYGFGSDCNNLTSYDANQSIEQAYLAGLKAGRPKWHKVADGDLPKAYDDGTNASKHVWVQFKSGNTGVCYYDWDLSGWFANGYLEQIKNILAWCEIPQYTEE